MNPTNTPSTDPPPVVALDPSGQGLRVRFFWHADRFAHVIDRVDGDRSIPVLSSVESDCTVEWPASPPIQQISVEQIRPDGTAALGVGAAGQGHWSISVVGGQAEGRPSLQFDLALRISDASHPPVGSQYQALLGCSGTGEGDASEDSSARCRIIPMPEVAATEVTNSPGSWSIAPRGETGKTRRWAYAVVLDPPA